MTQSLALIERLKTFARHYPVNLFSPQEGWKWFWSPFSWLTPPVVRTLPSLTGGDSGDVLHWKPSELLPVCLRLIIEIINYFFNYAFCPQQRQPPASLSRLSGAVFAALFPIMHPGASSIWAWNCPQQLTAACRLPQHILLKHPATAAGSLYSSQLFPPHSSSQISFDKSWFHFCCCCLPTRFIRQTLLYRSPGKRIDDEQAKKLF